MWGRPINLLLNEKTKQIDWLNLTLNCSRGRAFAFAMSLSNVSGGDHGNQTAGLIVQTRHEAAF